MAGDHRFQYMMNLEILQSEQWVKALIGWMYRAKIEVSVWQRIMGKEIGTGNGVFTLDTLQVVIND